MVVDLGILRDARWLSAERAAAWIRVLAVALLVFVLGLAVLTGGGTRPDPWGRPLATDFSSFWTAGELALTGRPSAAWNAAEHRAAELAEFAPQAGFAADYYAFFYPPVFLLLSAPLALLPYGLAAFAWLAATGAAYVGVVRKLLPSRWPGAMIALSYPAVLVNAGHGQNGMLSAFLFGAASLWLERRPWAAGLCLGSLCFKPQLALLAAPVLIVGRHWQALGAFILAIAILALGGLAAFGTSAWEAFLAAAPQAQSALEHGWVGYAKMVSTFAAIRTAGMGEPAAWAAQGVVSAAALLTATVVARRRTGAEAETAALAAGACLASPFLLDYDLTVLAVPLAWLAGAGARTGFEPWEKLILAGCFLLPLYARPVATTTSVQIAPLMIAALLVCVLRRAWRHPAGGLAA